GRCRWSRQLPMLLSAAMSTTDLPPQLQHHSPAEALRQADDAIERSRRRIRVKYEVARRETHGKALHALGRTHAALAELRSAVDLARPIGDPGMFLRVATSLLAIDGDGALRRPATARQAWSGR